MTNSQVDDNHATARGTAISASMAGADTLSAADLWFILDGLYAHWNEHKRTALADLMEKWQDTLVQTYPNMETD